MAGGVDVAAVQLPVGVLEPPMSAARRAGGTAVTTLDPPHVSLGHPWTALPPPWVMRAVVASHPPFELDVDGLRRFPPDARGRVTLHVALRGAAGVLRLARALGWVGPLTPHVSLVRGRDHAALDRAERAAADRLPSVVPVTCVEVSAQLAGCWRHVATLPLNPTPPVSFGQRLPFLQVRQPEAPYREARHDEEAGMTATLIPYLTVHDATAALDWYVTALGAVERARWTGDDGRVGHSEIAIGDAVLYLADEWPELAMSGPRALGGTPVMLHLSVVDTDHAYRRAVDHGAEGIRPPEDAHGDRVATVRDPFGHRWMFAQPQADGQREELSWQVTDRRPTELGYLVLGAGDLDRAIAFYGQVFDWRIERGGAGGGHVANTAFPLGLSPQGDGSVTPHFRVDDLDVYIERVERGGGRVRTRARHDSGETAGCVDDQGLRFDLWRPAAGF